MLHWDHYDQSTQDEHLRAYDQAMIETGIYEGRQVPVPGRHEQMEDYGWMEHCARRASQALRTELREVLSKQGFALE
jgi:hypothetical protein